jgi:hypothetical protein
MSQMRTKWWMPFGGMYAKQSDSGLLLYKQEQPLSSPATEGWQIEQAETSMEKIKQ